MVLVLGVVGASVSLVAAAGCAARAWRPLGAPFLLPLRGFLGVFGAAAAAGLHLGAAAFFRLMPCGTLWSALRPSALAFLMHKTAVDVSLAKKHGGTRA